MKSIIELVGDINSLGFSESIYKQVKNEVINKKYVNDIGFKIIKRLPLSSTHIIQIKLGQEFTAILKKDNTTYNIKFQKAKEDGYYLLIGTVKSDIKQNTGFRFKLDKLNIIELTCGKLSHVKHGPYYKYEKKGFNYKYYNELGKLTCEIKANYAYRDYMFVSKGQSCTYTFNEKKLVTFFNKEQDITLKFYSFSSSGKYRLSEAKKGSTTVSYFYKGNCKAITKVIAHRAEVTVFNYKGVIKCKYGYSVKTGLIDGEYVQYNSSGQMTRRYMVKNGDLHGVYENFKNGVLVEKSHYVDNKKEGKQTKIHNGVVEVSFYKNGKIASKGNKHGKSNNT